MNYYKITKFNKVVEIQLINKIKIVIIYINLNKKIQLLC